MNKVSALNLIQTINIAGTTTINQSIETLKYNQNEIQEIENDKFSKNVKDKSEGGFTNEEYKKLSKQAKKSDIIRNWIMGISKKDKHIFEEDKKELQNLNVSTSLKKFMLLNLKEKYEYVYNNKDYINEKKDSGEFGRAMSGYGGYVTAAPTMPVQSAPRIDTFLKEYRKKHPVFVEDGYGTTVTTVSSEYDKDYNETQDNWFSKDVTTIGWSAATIARYNYEYILNEIVELTKASAGLSIPLNSMSIALNTVKIAKSTQWINGISALSGNTFKYLSKYVAILNLATLPISIIDDIVNNEHESKGQKAFRVLGTTVIPTLTSLAPEIVGMFSATAISGPALPIVAIGASVFLLVKGLLSVIPSGNGHSLWSNWNDHGLNDWDYQIKNNKLAMYKTALSFSENLSAGVEWKVEDDWFELPELFIRRQGRSEYKHLSPGDSFNYGHKIEFKKSKHDPNISANEFEEIYRNNSQMRQMIANYNNA